MHDKTDTHYNELIKRRENYYRKKRNHDRNRIYKDKFHRASQEEEF